MQLVLETIWTVYGASTGGSNGKGDPTLLEKVTKSLSITLPPHILRSRDPKAVLQAVFSAWLPLSTALLVSVVEYLPSPPDSQAVRMPEMIGIYRPLHGNEVAYIRFAGDDPPVELLDQFGGLGQISFVAFG